jgi:hypothetical protein
MTTEDEEEEAWLEADATTGKAVSSRDAASTAADSENHFIRSG